MNNSIVKLEDFELDEISGGITAKQVAKKTAGYAIKGLSTLVFGFSFATLLTALEIDPETVEDVDFIAISFLALSSAGGWNFGEWLCKKIGLED